MSEAMSKVMVGVSKALPEIALKLLNDSQDLCPKVTGRLANSIRIMSLTNDKIVIGTNVEYGPAVEFGTTQMINAHGPHDFEKPVTNWKAKADRGSQDQTTMPFLSRAGYSNIRYIVETLSRYVQGEFK